MRNKKKALVSICIPSYNHEKFISQTIFSIINQSYDKIELIIIDDGSKDRSCQIIDGLKSICKKRFVRFKFIRQSNRGLNCSLNQAIKWSNGKYFAYVGSDDLFEINKIKYLVEMFEKENDPNLAGLFSSYKIINQKNYLVGKKICPNKNNTFSDIISWNYYLNTPGQLLILKFLRKVGGYKKNLFFEDWYMWLKLANENYRLKSISKILASYRVHENNMSKNIMKMFNSRFLILKNYKNHSLYNYSLSCNCLYTSIDLINENKLNSFKLMIKSFMLYPKIFFSYKFFFCLTKLIVPKFIFKNLSKCI